MFSPEMVVTLWEIQFGYGFRWLTDLCRIGLYRYCIREHDYRNVIFLFELEKCDYRIQSDKRQRDIAPELLIDLTNEIVLCVGFDLVTFCMGSVVDHADKIITAIPVTTVKTEWMNAFLLLKFLCNYIEWLSYSGRATFCFLFESTVISVIFWFDNCPFLGGKCTHSQECSRFLFPKEFFLKVSFRISERKIMEGQRYFNNLGFKIWNITPETLKKCLGQDEFNWKIRQKISSAQSTEEYSMIFWRKTYENNQKI